MTTTPRRLILALALFVLTASRALAGDSGGKLHALIVIDTLDRDIGKSVRIDGQNVAAMLRDYIPKNRLNLQVLQGDAITERNIRDYYTRLTVKAKDTVLFYYAGHGGTDPKAGHFLLTRGKTLTRSSLRSMIEAKRPRLTVILTDCCANIVKRYYYKTDDYQVRPANTLYLKLFFYHSGIVDWNGCSVKEEASGTDNEGGYFTKSFIETCHDLANGRRTTTWSELFADVRFTTKQKNRTQTPSAMTTLSKVKFEK